MIGLVLQMVRLLRAVASLVAEPQGRALAVLAALTAGTLFYSVVEGWRGSTLSTSASSR